MNRVFLLAAVLALLSCGKSQADNTTPQSTPTTPTTPPTPTPEPEPEPDDGWELVWEDNFDGTSINSANWSRVPYGTPDWQNMMAPKRADLAYVENGELVLLGKVNDHSGSETTTYVTGGVQSQNKKYFKLAKFEARVKFNSIQGFWPAVWLMPNGNVQWPKGGEIDIMEHINLEGIAYQTIHSYYTLNVDDSGHSASKTIQRDDWNTYAVEIFEDKICMYVNGTKTLTYSKKEGVANQWPFATYSYYLILSNQLEGSWAGNVTAPAKLPSELRVDWVRAYQRKDK